MPLAPVDREREEHLAGARRQRAVGDTEVAVCFGQHERNAQRQRSRPGGPRYVAPASDHHVHVLALQDRARRSGRARRETHSPRGLERVVAVGFPPPQPPKKGARGRHAVPPPAPPPPGKHPPPPPPPSG